jgi:hypothetical protein
LLLQVQIAFSQTSISAQTGQTNYSKEVEERIRQVEQNVSFVKFQIEGKPNRTIQERMAFHNITGLSIAVINNYKIEWRKVTAGLTLPKKRPVTAENTL